MMRPRSHATPKPQGILGKQVSDHGFGEAGLKEKESPEEEWPRGQSKETLSSPPPPMGTPKVQVFTEQLLMKGPEDLTEKILYN